MKAPFEKKQLKNYILLYLGVVIIVILFFISSKNFLDIQRVDKKVFTSTLNHTLNEDKTQVIQKSKNKHSLKLMEKSY